MTNDELKRALITGAPVVYERPEEMPIKYAYVSAIIYKRLSDLWALERECAKETSTPGIVMLAELRCGKAHRVTVAHPDYVRFRESATRGVSQNSPREDGRRKRMMNEELRRALITGAPVVHERPGDIPIEYSHISAIIYNRKPDLWALERGCAKETSAPEIVILAELRDRNSRSVTVAHPDFIKIMKGGRE